jgi:hypothetical protein
VRTNAWLVVVAGCASGGRDVTVDAHDVDGMPYFDAPIDGPAMRTLSQTTSSTLEAGTSISCNINPPGTSAVNYYRVFDLAAAGITGDFNVTSVSFQVEDCDQINGTSGTVVAVRVGTYSGTPGTQLANGSMTILASNPTVPIGEVIEAPGPPPVTAGETINAPITATVPAGQKLLVEIDAPDGHNQYSLFMGANNDGESAFGYVLSPACSITQPTNVSSINPNNPAVNLLITVTGQY